MNLNVDYFYRLTPREFANTVNGYRKREDNLSRERWMIARKIMWASLAPNSKNLKENQILEFPWEVELQEEFTEEDNAVLLEEIEKVEEFYRLQDEKLKNNALN